MVLFQIQCSTCQTSLHVHSDEVIGQIHACPKCGSMVLVERPGADVEQVSAVPTAVSGHSIPVLGVGESERSGLSRSLDDRTFEEAVRWVEEGEVSNESEEVDQGSLPSQQKPDADLPLRMESLEELERQESIQPLALVPDWANSRRSVWSRWGLYFGAVAVGVVGMVVLVVTSISWMTKWETIETSREMGPETAADNRQQELSQLEVTEDLTASSNLESRITDDEPSHESESEPVKSEGEEKQSFATIHASERVKGEEREVVTNNNSENSQTAKSEKVAVADLPQEVDLIASVEPVESTTTELIGGTTDLETRLAYSIPSLKFDEVGLLDCLRFLSDFSTIPITLPPATLLFAGGTPHSHVQLELNDKSVGEVLKEVLATHRMAYVVDDRHVVVINQSEDSSGLREIPYSVDDLSGPGAGDIDELVELIRGFVVPSAWNEPGTSLNVDPNDETLTVRQTGAVHWEIIVLCEKLRVARGLPLRSRYRPTLFELKPRSARAIAKLNGRLTLNYLEPVRLVDILDRLSEEVGIQFLVDWRRLYDVGQFPTTSTTLLADDKQLHELLESLLSPAGLDYRVVDASIIQVTTAEAAESHLDVEFYPVADLLHAGQTAEQLESRILETVGEGWFVPGQGAIHLDTVSSCFIVTLPQSRQRLLARQLEGWRETLGGSAT